MEFLNLCIPALAIFLASFFATVTGFGFGLIAIPLMSLVISVKVAIICGLIITVLLRIITMYNTRKTFSWDVVLTTVLGSSLGMIPGSYMLKIISLAHLKIFLGCVLLIATYLMGRKYHLEIKIKTLGRLTAGRVRDPLLFRRSQSDFRVGLLAGMRGAGASSGKSASAYRTRIPFLPEKISR